MSDLLLLVTVLAIGPILIAEGSGLHGRTAFASCYRVNQNARKRTSTASAMGHFRKRRWRTANV